MSDLKTFNIRIQLGAYYGTVPVKHRTAQLAHLLALEHLNMLAGARAPGENTTHALLDACETALADITQTTNYDQREPQTMATVAKLQSAIHRARFGIPTDANKDANTKMMQEVRITMEAPATIPTISLQTSICRALNAEFGADCVCKIEEEAEIYGNK